MMTLCSFKRLIQEDPEQTWQVSFPMPRPPQLGETIKLIVFTGGKGDDGSTKFMTIVGIEHELTYQPPDLSPRQQINYRVSFL